MAPSRNIDSGRPVRLGVIGAGLVGAKHAAIQGKETPRTAGEDALRTLSVIRAVLESGDRRKPVVLNFGDDIP